MNINIKEKSKIMNIRKTALTLTMLLTCTILCAQPSWQKKTSKAIFSLRTFAEDGTLIANANGFFVSQTGDAVSTFTPFKGATKAIVVDATGKEHEIDYILGANDTYDVVKFHVGGLKKQAFISIATQTSENGATVWMQTAQESKSLTKGHVTKAEKFNTEYDYYTVELQTAQVADGSPLFNEEGQVLGIMQHAAKADDPLRYAVSARFADSLRITGLSLNSPALRAVHIKKALPNELDQAVLTLYLGISSLDSLSFATLVNDFISKFPQAPDGYQYRAQLAFSGRNFEAAQRDMEKAITVSSTNKDDAHYAYARMILQKEQYMANLPYEPWSLQKAITECDAAYAENALPIYHQLKAQVLFTQKEYAKASAIYNQLATTNLRSAELFYEASRCKQMQADTLGQLALLDSAVNTFRKPYLKEAAPYLLSRAQLYLDMGKNREAVIDLNDYENVMSSYVNDNFYYLRFRAALGGRMYQQALNDINHAIEINAKSDLYLVEKASLQVRLGMYDDAIETSNKSIVMAPEHSDGYLFLGLAQCLKGNKTEGIKNLKKAGEMGDTQADELIEKYAK